MRRKCSVANSMQTHSIAEFVLWAASPFYFLVCKQARQDMTDFPFSSLCSVYLQIGNLVEAFWGLVKP